MWATGVVLLRRSGESVPPLALNLFKNSFAVLLFLITLPILGVALIPDASSLDWALLIVSGLLGLGIGDTMLLAGLNRIGASRMAIAECFYGPFVALGALAHPELNETWSYSLFFGLALVAFGIFLASRSETESEENPISQRDKVVGFSLAIGSVAIMATGVVVAKPVLERHDVWWCTLVRFIGGLGLLYPMAFVRQKTRGEALAVLRPSALWKQLVPTAFIATYLAMILLFTGLKYTTATRASVMNQTSTFFILIFAWLFLKEALTLRRTVAILFGFGGAMVVILT